MLLSFVTEFSSIRFSNSNIVVVIIADLMMHAQCFQQAPHREWKTFL